MESTSGSGEEADKAVLQEGAAKETSNQSEKSTEESILQRYQSRVESSFSVLDQLAPKPTEAADLRPPPPPPQPGLLSTRDKSCFDFTQTGRCRFGQRCRFQHVQPDHLINPAKYTRYELPPELEGGETENRAALASALAVATTLRAKVDAAEEAADRTAAEAEAKARAARLAAKKERTRAELQSNKGDRPKAKRGAGPRLSFMAEDEEEC
mmetsp:Transcript_14198/g.33496  ORF Transcript_14198/g.33496 Transcript_14198/m.33496 type:complete len:211 (+) Transcript_14198:1-633(+)